MSEAPKPESTASFFGAALIAVGVLMMALCGGCGAVFFVLFVADGVMHPNDMTMALMPIVLGGVPALIGWGLFRWGRGLRRGAQPQAAARFRLRPADPQAGHLVGHLVGRAALGLGAVEDLVQGLHQPVELGLHPGRVEGLVPGQCADLAGDVYDPAAVDHIVGQVEEPVVVDRLADIGVRELVVGPAGDHRGTASRGRVSRR